MHETRRHAAIMFTDIVGYTRLMGSDEEKAVDMLSRNRSLHQSCIEKFNGTLIKEIGDGILASFSLASEAVRCAIEIQKECKEQGIPLKIGIHEGEMIFSGSDVIGDGVNIASRLQQDAQEGCINISPAVYSNIKNKVDIQAKLIGEKSYKNVGESIKVYRVICGEEEYFEKQLSQDNSKRKTRSKLPVYLILGGVIVILVVLLIWKFIPSKEKAELDKSIAVLPLDYLSEDHNKKYLADGVMDAITGHLSKIDGLIVRPRTSVEKYRDTERSASEIGKELNVSYIIEGSFLMVENQVKLTVQLIVAGKEDHIFFKEYDRDYKDIINVQSEVAQTIANEINVAINPDVRKIIERVPTNNLSAYDYYLQGNDFQHRSTYENDLKIAIEMYKKAVGIDSSFTLAWIGLASSSRQLFWFYYDRSDENLERIRFYLDQALILSPDLKEVKIEESMYYYHCKRRYQKALQILEPLRSKHPQDEEINRYIGFVYRRMSEYEKSLEYNELAISINPSNWFNWHNIGFTFVALRRYNQAEKSWKTTIDLNPTYHLAYIQLLNLYIITGQIKKAKEYCEKNQKFIDRPDIKITKAKLEVFEKKYERAIQIVNSLDEGEITDQLYFFTKHLQLGLIYFIMSNKKKASEHFDKERIFLIDKINTSMNDDRLYRSLGIAYAGLGMKNEAIEAGQKALDILSFDNDAHGGYSNEIDMVKILLMVGEHDDALDRLDKIVSQNGNITVEVLKLDPFWNPVRDMDKFKEIISNPKYQIELSEN